MGRPFVLIAALLVMLLALEFTPGCHGKALAKGRISKQDDSSNSTDSNDFGDFSDLGLVNLFGGSSIDDSTFDSDDVCEVKEDFIEFLIAILWGVNDNDNSTEESSGEPNTPSKQKTKSLTRRLVTLAQKNRKVKDNSNNECEGADDFIDFLLSILLGDDSSFDSLPDDSTPDSSDGSGTATSSKQKAKSLTRRLAALVKKTHKVNDNSDGECKDAEDFVDFLLSMLLENDESYYSGLDITPDSSAQTTTAPTKRAKASKLFSLTKRLIEVANKNRKVKDNSEENCEDAKDFIDLLLFILLGNDSSFDSLPDDSSPDSSAGRETASSTNATKSLTRRLAAITKKNHKAVVTAIKGAQSAKKTSAEKIKLLTTLLNKLDKKH